MGKVNDLLQERYGLTKKAREIIKGADGREMTAEERSAYDKIMADVDKLGNQAETMKADEARAAKLDGIEKEMEKPVDRAIMPDIGTRWDKRGSPEYRKAFNSYLLATDMGAEARALQMDLDASGGYTVVPQQFLSQLIEAEKATFSVRGLASVFSVPGAESLGAPVLDNRPADTTWTSELLIGDADSTMSFGKRELRPQPMAQYIKVSKKLVRASALSIDSLIANQLGYKVGYVEENAFLNGTGVNQPLGVFTASALGINTGQDVSTGNTITAITADGLIEAKYKLRSAYWPKSRWIFHQDAIKQIRKLRGNDGDFLWKAGLANDRGDTLLDVPIVVSELVPHTFTTGLYVGIIGDFSKYWVADALDTTLQVLTELYAATNQNGYIIRKETDGAPVLEEAFVRVTLA
jgi:HK97 family phage major capsid protein